MQFMRLSAALAAATILTGCVVQPSDIESARDRTLGGELVEVTPTTWIDPDGCEHWVFDTGFEGFMSPKLDRQGRPICSASGFAAPSASAVPGGLTFGTIRGARDSNDNLSFVVTGAATFAFDSARLNTTAARDLDALFTYLRDEGVNLVLIVGHTDSVGSAAYNRDLSLRRARTVQAFAQRYGISSEIRGAGESEPIQSNDTDAGRAANRRVEISIL